MSMRKLCSGKNNVWIMPLDRPYSFCSPFQGEDFAMMLIVNDCSISREEQSLLSDEFVKQGCRFAVCTGYDCSSWDDSIDMAFISTDVEFNPSDDRFVMTTWHENETIEEVAFFLLWCARFPGFDPRNFLALLLGSDANVENQVIEALTAHFDALE